MSNNQLSIRLNGEPVGILEQATNGKMSFTYYENSTRPISLSMPICKESYNDAQCVAFFGGLLPESETAKKEIAKRYGISYSNSFSLLKAIGYDCAGAISCHDIDEPISSERSFELKGRIVSDAELYNHIQNLPKKPLFLDVEGLRLSLAGVHDKAAICLIDNQIAFPEDGCPTTHILKPFSRIYDGLVEDEYCCLEMASQMGLCIPRVEIRQIKDISFLLVERYDRQIKNKKVERIHQEDFCQAMGISSGRKYQHEGGPGFKECFELLNKTIQPAIARNMLMSAVVFNFLIGNMDAHGKNFSLLYTASSQFVLAPFYDIVCTRVYPDLTAKMAMKIGSKYDADDIFPRHWEQLCEDIQYSFPALKQLIKKQGENILKSIDHNKEFFITMTQKASIIDKLSEFLKRNIDKTLKRFEFL